MQPQVTVEDIDAILSDSKPVAGTLARLAEAPADTDQLLELACEEDERGALAAITALLEGLRVRHVQDDATCAVLAAIEYYHLPALVEEAGQGGAE